MQIKLNTEDNKTYIFTIHSATISENKILLEDTFYNVSISREQIIFEDSKSIPHLNIKDIQINGKKYTVKEFDKIKTLLF